MLKGNKLRSGAGSDGNSWRNMAVILVVTATIFAIDITAPRGASIAILYLFPLLLSFHFKRSGYFAFPLFLTFVAVSAAFLKTAGGVPAAVAILNRSLAVFTFWLTAFLVRRRDISVEEIYESEKSLGEFRSDLNRAQAVAHTGSWRLDVRKNILTWSDEACRIFAVPQGTPLTYETFLQHVHPDDREYVDRRWKASLRGEAYDIEHRIIVEGNVKWVREKAEMEFDGEGRLLGGFGTVQDITDHKRSEEALRQSEIRYRNLIDTANSIIMRWKPDGTIIFINEFGLDFFGYSGNELTGKNVMVLVPAVESSGRDLTGLIEDIVNNPANYRSFENENVKKNGERVRVLWSNRLIKDNEGTVEEILAIGNDISELKKTSDQLRRSEYELRTLVDNSPDLLFRIDKEMRYVFANPAYERLTGMSKEQLMSKTGGELGMPQELVGLWQSAVRKVVESGREHSVEFGAAGFFADRYFLARLIPEFAKPGVIETVLVIARDITERKRAEERIRFISFHDEVTGLFNRAFFEEELRRADADRGLPVSIIMGDVNFLKLSNDVFGHQEGDNLLKAVAAAIRNGCRKNDIVARWGGDEFAMILPETDFETANNEICVRIKQLVSESEGAVIRPGIALGVATKERGDQNIYDVIRTAEVRMYENKIAESGKNEKELISLLEKRVREKLQGMAAYTAQSLELARRFGNVLGLEEGQMKNLLLLIEMHDMGIIVIPREILAKPARLSRDEWELVRKHAEAGFRIVKSFSGTVKISYEVLCHGERWDGSGYPRGLKGREIPYLARIFAVIKAYNAMTHRRPYAPVLTREEAVEELRRNAGKQFDPEVVDVFISSVQPQIPV